MKYSWVFLMPLILFYFSWNVNAACFLLKDMQWSRKLRQFGSDQHPSPKSWVLCAPIKTTWQPLTGLQPVCIFCL